MGRRRKAMEKDDRLARAPRARGVVIQSRAANVDELTAHGRKPSSSARAQTPTALSASHSTIFPAIAEAATVYGDARYSWPGPDRPGKFRLIAEIVTSVFVRETPGPALMHAPHDGSTKIAPISLKTRS